MSCGWTGVPEHLCGEGAVEERGLDPGDVGSPRPEPPGRTRSWISRKGSTRLSSWRGSGLVRPTCRSLRIPFAPGAAPRGARTGRPGRTAWPSGDSDGRVAKVRCGKTPGRSWWGRLRLYSWKLRLRPAASEDGPIEHGVAERFEVVIDYTSRAAMASTTTYRPAAAGRERESLDVEPVEAVGDHVPLVATRKATTAVALFAPPSVTCPGDHGGHTRRATFPMMDRTGTGPNERESTEPRRWSPSRNTVPWGTRTGPK